MKYTPDGDMEIDLSELAKILTDKIPSDILYSSDILVNNALVGDCGRILANYKNEDVWRLYGFLHVSAGYWIKEVLRNKKYPVSKLDSRDLISNMNLYSQLEQRLFPIQSLSIFISHSRTSRIMMVVIVLCCNHYYPVLPE